MAMGKIATLTLDLAKNFQPAHTDGFSRLSGLFRHGINYRNYDSFVPSAKNKLVGNLPSSLLQLIIKNNPETKADAIKSVQQSFKEAAAILAENNKVHLQAINRFSSTIDNAVEMIENINDAYPKFYQDKIFLEKSTEILIMAEEKILSALKKTIPDVKNVKVSYLGQGGFAQTYRCEIIDNNDQKIIPDRVIKLFRDDNVNFMLQILAKAHEVMSKFSANLISRMAKQKGLLIEDNTVKDIQLDFKIANETIHDASVSKAKQEKLRQKHGAYAEANTAEYIKYMYGKKLKPEDGIVIPDLFYLGDTKFALAQYVDSSIKTDKVFDFSRLGLYHSDLNEKPSNTINGVCIDMGGIMPECLRKTSNSVTNFFGDFLKLIFSPQSMTQSYIVGDKFATRLLKKYQSCKTPKEKFEMLEVFRQKAKQVTNEVIKRKYLNVIDEIQTIQYIDYLNSPA